MSAFNNDSVLPASVFADSRIINIELNEATSSSSLLTVYAAFVHRLFKYLDTEQASLIHAGVGVSGEAGELLDALKKHWIYNKPLDRANIVEELGDLRFYMQALQNMLGITDNEILQANVEKLKVRYAGLKYSDQAAQDRADKTISGETEKE